MVLNGTKRSLMIGVVGASLLCATPSLAQDAGNTIGPPQLRDFQLRPREQPVAPTAGPQDPQNPQPQVRQPPPNEKSPLPRPRMTWIR